MEATIADRLGNTLERCKQRQLTGFVYFIQCNEYVKIGLALDVPERLCQLQTGNPYPLMIVAIIPSLTPDVLEEELHGKVEQYRVRGEWFKLPERVLEDLLRSLRTPEN